MKTAKVLHRSIHERFLRNWRTSLKELQTLYQRGAGPRNMTVYLKTTGWLIWSAETKDTMLACHFNFISGEENWYNHSIYQGRRVFAVRFQRK